jgi:hypothetical protein
MPDVEQQHDFSLVLGLKVEVQSLWHPDDWPPRMTEKLLGTRDEQT